MFSLTPGRHRRVFSDSGQCLKKKTILSLTLINSNTCIYSVPFTGKRRARDIWTVRRSSGQSHRVHLRIGQYAPVADSRQPRRRHRATAFRYGHVSGPQTSEQSLPGSDRLSGLEEDRDCVRRRGR